jgi:hypothetical protein
LVRSQTALVHFGQGVPCIAIDRTCAFKMTHYM